MSDLQRLVRGYVDDGKRREIEDYFARRNWTSLEQVRISRPLAKLLNFRSNRLNNFKRGLYNQGFFTEVPIASVIDSIRFRKRAKKHPYLDPKIVGEEGVERTKEVVLASDEFREYMNKRYYSLIYVGIDLSLNNLIGIGNKNILTNLRKWLFENDYCQELDLNLFFDKGGKWVRRSYQPYFDPEIVGTEAAERYKEQVWNSEEFERVLCGDFESLFERPSDYGELQ
ncbi:hypothetical protein HOE91_03590 [archaeon]|nr:hypothetical protein [archaeon]